MKDFKTWLERREHMAKGINLSDPATLKHMVGLKLVDGLTNQQIANDSEVAKLGLPTHKAVAQNLRKVGIGQGSMSAINKVKMQANAQSQKDYDKTHNRNKYGGNPERDIASQRTQRAMQGLEPLHPYEAQHVVLPSGYQKVRDAEGNIWARPENYPVDHEAGEKVVSPSRRKEYDKLPVSTPQVDAEKRFTPQVLPQPISKKTLDFGRKAV